jgi:hypothetical protein
VLNEFICVVEGGLEIASLIGGITEAAKRVLVEAILARFLAKARSQRKREPNLCLVLTGVEVSSVELSVSESCSIKRLGPRPRRTE